MDNLPKINIEPWSPDQRTEFLKWLAFGYSVEEATIKMGDTELTYTATKEAYPEWSAKISEAIRIRGPIPKRKLAKFSTQEDRKQTHLELRDLYRIDDKIGMYIMSLDLEDKDDRKAMARIAHARWNSQDKNVHQETTLRIEEIQAVDGKPEALIQILENSQRTLQELVETQQRVAAMHERALSSDLDEAETKEVAEEVQPTDPDFARLLEQRSSDG